VFTALDMIDTAEADECWLRVEWRDEGSVAVCMAGGRVNQLMVSAWKSRDALTASSNNISAFCYNAKASTECRRISRTYAASM
jgi:hypothetical protein